MTETIIAMAIKIINRITATIFIRIGIDFTICFTFFIKLLIFLIGSFSCFLSYHKRENYATLILYKINFLECILSFK